MADDRLVELISELLIETKTNNKRMEERLEKLELQQVRTNLVLQQIDTHLGEVLDKLDFDTVHFNQEV